MLAARIDLDPKVAETLRSAVAAARPIEPVPAVADTDPQSAIRRAQALKQTGKLDDRAILDALRRNAVKEASAMLAVKADVPVALIERACALRSAKGVVSLAWKAGLTVQTAVVLQVALAHLPPDLILRAGPDAKFPLSDDEMRWQLSFLDTPERGPRAWVPRRLSE